MTEEYFVLLFSNSLFLLCFIVGELFFTSFVVFVHLWWFLTLFLVGVVVLERCILYFVCVWLLFWRV